jgi:alcohol dehydrogenase
MVAPGTGDSAGNDIGERLPSARRDRVSIPTLLKLVASGRIPAEKMGTHSFTFAQMDEAYDVFKNAAENSALKVVITPT